MEQLQFGSARRRILFLLLVTMSIALPVWTWITPLLVSFVHQHQGIGLPSEYWWASVVVAWMLGGALAWLADRYLTPVTRLSRILLEDGDPAPQVVLEARRAALNGPIYVSSILLGAAIGWAFLSIMGRALFISDFNVVLHISEILVIVALIVVVALAQAFFVRRWLRPGLVIIQHLVRFLGISCPPVGVRFDIRVRILVTILATSLISFYFPAVLAFNVVYQSAWKSARDGARLWIETTIERASSLDAGAVIRLVEDTDVPFPDRAQAYIVDRSGRYVARSDPGLNDEEAGGAGYEDVRLSMKRPENDWYLGVRYRFDAGADALVRGTLIRLVGGAVAILLVCLFSAGVMTTDAVEGLRQLTRHLQEAIRNEEVEEALTIPSGDEVGDLVRAFNKVQARLMHQQEALRQDHHHLLVLQEISSSISSIFDLQKLLAELVRQMRSAFGYHNVVIYLTDDEGEDLYVATSDRALSSEEWDRRIKIGSEDLVGRVASAERALTVPDVSRCTFCTDDDPSVRSKLAVPMLVGGLLVGVLSLESDQVDGFGPRVVQLMTALSNQAAAAVEAVRLLQQSQATALALERRARNLMLINRVSTTLTSSLDASEVLNMTVRHLVELITMDYGGVLILEPGTRHGVIIAEYPVSRFVDMHISLQRTPSLERVLNMGIPYGIENGMTHSFLEPFRAHMSPADVRSVLLVPLVARGEMIGVLFLASIEQARTFSEEEMEICQTVASQAAVAVANARLLQDIQQQRRALARKTQELTEESSKLDAILSNMADGLVVTDPMGRIILSNPVFREMAGLPPGRSLRNLLLAGSFPAADLQMLVTQALEVPGQVLTANLELPGGQVLKASATAMRLQPTLLDLDQDEQIAGVATVLRDITHEVEVDRMKTDFISAVSHELRSPLTAVLGFASLIRRDFLRSIAPFMNLDNNTKARYVAERIMENLSIIENESERLTRLINDLLDIAKMESGRMEWQMAETGLDGVIRDAVTATTALAEEKGLEVQVRLLSEASPLIWGHYDRLIQVMTNLLSNAIKFTEEGSVEVCCWMLGVEADGLRVEGPVPTFRGCESKDVIADSQVPAGDWWVVSVVDTGVGIPPESLPKLFKKFSQVGATLTERPSGTGLGLAICKEIVEYHKGYIWAVSDQGRGSTFSFALPVLPKEVAVQERLDGHTYPAERWFDERPASA